jgi:PAS domain S-box-containing protein
VRESRDQAREALTAAERSSRRTALLLETSLALSRTLTTGEVAEVIARQSARASGAAACVVFLLVEDDQMLEQVRAAGYPDHLRDLQRRFPLDTDAPVTEAARTGRSQWHESREAMLERYPQWRAEATATGLEGAVVALPFVVDGRTIGALALQYAERRALDNEEQTFLRALAQQCAQALDRARLFELAREARGEAAANEDRHRFLVEALPQILWVQSARGSETIQFYNRHWYEFTGLDPETPITAEIAAAVVHPQDRLRISETWATANAGGQPWHQVYRLHRASDDTWRWHRGYLLPERDASGAIVRWLGTAHDVDDLKRGEERLRFIARASEELSSSLDFETTLANVAKLAVPEFADWCSIEMVGPDGTIRNVAVAHVDPGKVTLAREFQRRWPMNPDDPTGVPNVIRTGQPERVPEITDEMIVAGARDPDQLRLLRELGLRSYMAVPLLARDEVLGAITFITAESTRRYDDADVELATDLARRAATAIENARLYDSVRLAEDQLRRYAATLEERVRERTASLRETIEELEAFSSSVSHDLRAPIRAIQGYADALLEEYGDRIDGAGREYVQRTMDSARRMDALIRDLLAYSRMSREELIIEPISLKAVVEDALAAAHRELEAAGATAHVTLDAALPPVMAHRAALFQVVSNLISNAIKFVAAGTVPRLRIGGKAADGRVTLWVEDNGIGIAPEHRERIFGVFHRLHSGELYPGTGVGLAIVRKAMERMGGTVTLDSEPGRGSRFTISLPEAARVRGR